MAKDSTTPTVSSEDRWVNVAGDQIPFLSAGDSGPGIVMVHGGGSSRLEWAESMGPLALDHQAVAPDLIGFGESPRRNILHTTEYMGKFLLKWHSAIQRRSSVWFSYLLSDLAISLESANC